MPLTFTPEQEELRAVFRRFLATYSDEAQVRAQLDSDLGYDPGVWKLMADQLGIQGIAIPEEYGGAGFGFGELSVVLEEAGRSLLCSPLFATVVLAATTLLESGGAAAAQEHLPGIAEASRRSPGRRADREEDERWCEGGVPVPRRARTACALRVTSTSPTWSTAPRPTWSVVAPARTESGLSHCLHSRPGPRYRIYSLARSLNPSPTRGPRLSSSPGPGRGSSASRGRGPQHTPSRRLDVAAAALT